MVSDRRRILELALESLENRKRQLDQEIAEITSELRGTAAARTKPSPATASAEGATSRTRKRPRFSKEERQRRSERMKAYWENRRKKKATPK
ncbi:MAG: hypothetical protein GXX84_02610 [Acidobacteria bacterium]|nr:hypothetical protein [Acidobacteriota bacterium]